MMDEKVSLDYTSCGSLNFMPSKKVLKVAEMIEQTKKGSREPAVRKTAYEAVKKIYNEPLDIKRMSDEERNKAAEAIFLWVRDNIAYINDPPGDHFQPAVATLEVRAGDCDDQAILLAAMLGSIGFEPIFVVLPDHVYVELQQSDGEQIPMDPTVKNARFGELPKGMRDYIEERYGLAFKDYLRVPIGHHIIVTPEKEIVETKRPLEMAVHNEEKGAASFRKKEYRSAKHNFLAAAKMYYEAALHTDPEEVKEGLLASSKFCDGWRHLTQMMHLILHHHEDHLSLLQSIINQARRSFEASRLYFEKVGKTELAGGIVAICATLAGYEEMLLGAFLRHLQDDDASRRHYAKAKENFNMAMARTELPGLRDHIQQALDSLPDYDIPLPRRERLGEGERIEKIRPDTKDVRSLSERFDIATEELEKIQKRLASLKVDQLRKEIFALAIETGIPVNIMEAIYSQSSEILLRVAHPHPKDRYGNVVRVHPEIIEQLGLQKIDQARIIFSGKEHMVTVRPLDDCDRDVIKVNRMMRDVLRVNVGDMVKLERGYLR
jgi:tetratricopeptide (TPR) repeat protein